MAQQSEASIPRAGKRKWGYDPDQVDEFLEHAHALYDGDGVQLTQRDIQNVSFDLTRGGYVIAQVDAALARLERAVVDKQTAREISQHGRVAWKAQTEDLYHDVARHVGRANGERFSSGKPHVPSYDRKQVDKLADRIVDKCAAELGIDGISKEDVKGFDKITAEAVANSVFTQRKGKKGYDERQVDYFLNSCVQLLSRIESYGRISDRIAPNEGEKSEVPAMAAVAPAVSAAAAGADAPLISADAQFQSAVSESLNTPEPTPVNTGDSFSEVSQAEQSLFSQPVQQSIFDQAAEPVQSAGNVSTSSIFPAQGSDENNTAIPPSFAPPVVNTDHAEAAAAQSQQQVTDEPSATSSASIFAPAESVNPIPQQDRTPLPSFEPAAQSHPVEAPAVEVSAAFAPSSAAPESFAPASDSIFAPPRQTAPAPAGTTAPAARPTSVNASLASLAHMAEVSQELPKIEEKSFVPKVPSLDAPSPFASTSFPSFAPAGDETPQTVHQNDDGNGGNGADSTDKGVKFDFTFPGADIPDLSFPTFDNEKKEQ